MALTDYGSFAQGSGYVLAAFVTGLFSRRSSSPGSQVSNTINVSYFGFQPPEVVPPRSPAIGWKIVSFVLLLLAVNPIVNAFREGPANGPHTRAQGSPATPATTAPTVHDGAPVVASHPTTSGVVRAAAVYTPTHAMHVLNGYYAAVHVPVRDRDPADFLPWVRFPLHWYSSPKLVATPKDLGAIVWPTTSAGADHFMPAHFTRVCHTSDTGIEVSTTVSSEDTRTHKVVGAPSIVLYYLVRQSDGGLRIGAIRGLTHGSC